MTSFLMDIGMSIFSGLQILMIIAIIIFILFSGGTTAIIIRLIIKHILK